MDRHGLGGAEQRPVSRVDQPGRPSDLPQQFRLASTSRGPRTAITSTSRGPHCEHVERRTGHRARLAGSTLAVVPSAA